MTVNIGIDEQNRHAVANGLAVLLADSYLLYLKTQSFHWNVTGPHFHSLHEQFEDMYTELVQAIDAIAERIRALGFPAPGSFQPERVRLWATESPLFPVEARSRPPRRARRPSS